MSARARSSARLAPKPRSAITAPKRSITKACAILVLAARNAGIGRFILVSSLAVTHPEHPLNNFGRVLDWKRRGEDALRTSGLLYTIVRPGGLTDAPGGASALKVDQGDRISGMISRSDVAAVCVAALDEIATYHTTFEIVAEEGTPPEHLPNLFASLKTDRELNNPK
ncbi:MAG: NAD(P)H-binding protein [Anaerolineae bacterium]